MTNPILNAILKHYGPTSYVRSEEQLRREEKLFGLVPFNRWFLIFAALVIQFACGSLYAWSVFNSNLDAKFYGNAAAGISPNIFYVAVGMFGISAAGFGPWLERNGPRKGCLVGGTLYFMGNCISAIGIFTNVHALVFIGYGVFGGSGLGLSYISPVSSLQKWFPDRRGMASGFAVCAFGGGSIVIGLVIRPLIELVGLGWTFIVLGLCYYIPMIFAALILRTPPPNYVVNGLTADRVQVNTTQQSTTVVSEKTEKTALDTAIDIPVPTQPSVKLTLIESLTSREYALMYIMFFANCITGLVVISRLSNIITEVYSENFPNEKAAGDFGALIVSINGVMNLIGRIGFSFLSDYVGRKTVFLITLGVQIIVLAFIPILFETTSGLYSFIACMFALSACYGSGFGVIPAFLADQFGSTNIGACHGVMLTSWALAGVGGGLVFSAIFKQLKGTIEYRYGFNFHWLLVIVCIGFVVTFFLRTDIKDRLLPPVEGQWVRMRIAGRQVRIVKGRVQVLTKEQEEEEWESYLAEHRQDRTASMNKHFS